jgi:cellulose synthase/poly-beta-1,6-N-acetylglucosamine synthase-like glycosyltransferase
MPEFEFLEVRMGFLSLFLMGLCTVLPMIHVVVTFWPRGKAEVAGGSPRDVSQGLPTDVPFSVLIPCYNERGILTTALAGLLRLKQRTEIVFINDGSTDDTLDWLKEHLELAPLVEAGDASIKANALVHEPIRGVYASERYPHIRVIDKQNGGKADSLNAGLRYCSHELVVTLDADSVLHKDALGYCARAFAEGSVVAGGGVIHILQGSRKFHARNTAPLNVLIKAQMMEYMKGFFILKKSLARMNAMLVISGAFGVFRRELLLELQGFRQTIGEDIDLTIRIQDHLMRNPEQKMVCISEAICYTECPETWRDIFKQRIRWQKAFVDCVVSYRGLLLRNVWRKAFAFFVVMDAIVAGTLSTYFTVAAVVATLVFPAMNHEWLYWYVALSTMTTFVYNALAIVQARRSARSPMTWVEFGEYVQVILVDLLFWRFMNFVFIIVGTILYFFNNSDWNKVARTQHEYSV